MVVGLLGISLFINMLVTGTIYSAIMFVCLFMLPISLYCDFHREETLKEMFLRKKNSKKVLKKEKKNSKKVLNSADSGRKRRKYERNYI